MVRRATVLVATLVVAAVAAGCGGGASPTLTPTDLAWSKSMADTVCAEWRDNDVMSDDQRYDAAAAVVGESDALRFVFAVDATCDALGALAGDPSDPATIAEVMDLVVTTDDFERIDE
jgi:hypothetical protein